MLLYYNKCYSIIIYKYNIIDVIYYINYVAIQHDTNFITSFQARFKMIKIPHEGIIQRI